MKKHHSPFIIVFLTMAMLLVAPLQSMAADLDKSETVYAELNSDGSVKNVLVVNHINTPEEGTYVDYGDYSSINNITGKEVPTVDGEKIIWDLPAYENGFYYIGTMKSPVLPWNLSITYRLDGKAVEAKELAGKTGEVTIHIKAKPNSDIRSEFRNRFAMQLTQSLNTDLCSEITAKDATSVIAGKSNSLAYTVLPRESLDETIIFEAKDLELSGISVILSPFSMSSFSKMTDKIDLMYDAMDQLIDGNRQLQTGFEDIFAAIGGIQNGAGTLNQGTGAISEGLQEYAQGLSAFSDYVNVFATKMEESLGALEKTTEEIETAEKALNQSSQKIHEILTQIDREATGYQNLIGQLESSLTALNDGLTQISQSIAALKSANDQIGTQLEKILGQYTLLKNQYSGAVANLNNLPDYSALATKLRSYDDPDVQALANAYLQNQAAVSGAVSALEGLNQGFDTVNSTFQSGIDQMTEGYLGISGGLEQIQAAIAETSKGLSGFDFSPLKKQLTSLQGELNQSASLLKQFKLDEIAVDFMEYVQGLQGAQVAVKELKTGFREIQAGMEEQLFPGISTLHQGVSTLYENMGDYPKGLQLFMDAQIAMKNGIGEAISSFGPKSSSVNKNLSYASEQGSANSLQFVMSTPTIAKDTTVYTAPEEEEITLIQRIKNLFS